MKDSEILRRLLTYERSLARNYLIFARQTGNGDMEDLFARMAREGQERIKVLEGMLKKHCPT